MLGLVRALTVLRAIWDRHVASTALQSTFRAPQRVHAACTVSSRDSGQIEMLSSSVVGFATTGSAPTLPETFEVFFGLILDESLLIGSFLELRSRGLRERGSIGSRRQNISPKRVAKRVQIPICL
jgi:hypothetical protein